MATDDDLHSLRQLAEKVIVCACDKDLIGFVEFDRQLHLGLLSLSSNAELVSVVASLRSRARLYGIARLADTGELVVSANEHLEILNLNEKGDGDGVATATLRHIGHVRGDDAGPVWPNRCARPRSPSHRSGLRQAASHQVTEECKPSGTEFSWRRVDP